MNPLALIGAASVSLLAGCAVPDFGAMTTSTDEVEERKEWKI